MDTTHIALSGRMIPLAIRRHARARRISLKLSPARDAIVMTLPRRASVAAGMDFFHSKEQWVLAHVETDKTVPLCDGEILHVLGERCIIRRMDGRGLSMLEEGELRVYSAPEFVSRRARDFLKKHLQAQCLMRAEAMAAKIGKAVRSVKIRQTRSRWGSCSATGLLTFHWQLVFAHPAILDYLVAHEVAHLAYMNHSADFWQTVAALCPDHKAARRWLKREGHTLHRYVL